MVLPQLTRSAPSAGSTRILDGAPGAPEGCGVAETLKDIVPDDWEDDKDQVKGLAAQPGNGKVDLTWTAVNNVTGYLVAYGTSENNMACTPSGVLISKG